MPRALIQSHAENCKGRVTKASVRKTDAAGHSSVQSLPLTPEPKQDPLPHADSQSTPAVSQQQQISSTAGNALSFLMAEQRERSQVLVFFMEQLPDNTWQAHWWTKGATSTAVASSQIPQQSTTTAAAAANPAASTPSSPAVWSATTQISSSILQSTGSSSTGSSKAKVTVQLQTNVAPGAEGDLVQLTGAAISTFKGSPSLLKSALQKNVRLCRAAPAVSDWIS